MQLNNHTFYVFVNLHNHIYKLSQDLAARNILVGDKETCKVTDFSLLQEIPKDDSIHQMQTNVPCPVRWMPPESLSQRKFSTASDVWSFGVLQWEMFNPKKTPYGSFSNMEVAMKVREREGGGGGGRELVTLYKFI